MWSLHHSKTHGQTLTLDLLYDYCRSLFDQNETSRNSADSIADNPEICKHKKTNENVEKKNAKLLTFQLILNFTKSTVFRMAHMALQ